MSATAEHAPPAIVVYGIDEGRKPHASVFSAADADLAEKAAAMMGMRAFRLTEPEHVATVVGLPQGRIFGTGKAFVPFTKMAVYDRLAALGSQPEPKADSRAVVPVGQSDTANGIESDEHESADRPTGEAEPANDTEAPELGAERPDPLRVGLCVLAPERLASWWEAIVVELKNDAVVLKWRDFEDEPPFERGRHQIAFLPDGFEVPV